LKEREVLLKIAPHLVWPARFILPHDESLRPTLVIASGLLLYDWLAPRKLLERSRRLDLRKAKEGMPLKEKFVAGFVYSDCRVDDSRLVVLNAVDARARGADIRTGIRCISAKRESRLWNATLLDLHRATTATVTARALVNAAGPWAAKLLTGVIGCNAGKAKLQLVKGSHILVSRLYEGEQCYVLQNEDRRIVFVMPYETKYSLIGTTEVPFQEDPAAAKISPEEIAYLCAAVSRYFCKSLAPNDVLESFSGVRPLYDDGAATASAATREYVLELDAPPDSAPLLSVLGGKVTTYRRLAEDAIDRLAPFLKSPRTTHWTATAPLPGDDMPDGNFDQFLRTFQDKYPWLDIGTASRLAHAYGTRAEVILGEAQRACDLGIDFGAGLTQAEIDYLMDQEFARTAEDILWRRSKLGLHLSPGECARVSVYVDERVKCQGRKALDSPASG
jgi:glycerol-3-phosphate dehydrogenase